MNASALIVGRREAISNWFRRFSTLIDAGNRLFKQQENLFGIFSWGTFKPLPKIDYVLIFRHVFAKCEACSVDEYENSHFAYYQVSLVYKKTRRIVVHETRNRQEAFTMGMDLARELHLHLKDAASVKGRSTWLM